MSFVAGHKLCLGRPRCDAARPAIKAGAIHGGVVDDHRFVDVGVVDDGGVHVDYRGVICETPATPFAAEKPNAAIAKAIIHAAVEADVRSPIARMPSVHAAAPAPVAWSPKQAHPRGSEPHTGHPVVAAIAISPIARSPKMPFNRARRLYVHGYGWRRYTD